VVNGEPVGAATVFADTAKMAILHRYRDQAGGTAQVVWLLEGAELTRSEREIGAGDGWVSFSLMAGGGQMLPPGRYEVVLTMPGRPAARAGFTIGGGRAGLSHLPRSGQRPRRSRPLTVHTFAARISALPPQSRQVMARPPRNAPPTAGRIGRFASPEVCRRCSTGSHARIIVTVALAALLAVPLAAQPPLLNSSAPGAFGVRYLPDRAVVTYTVDRPRRLSGEHLHAPRAAARTGAVGLC
jgi:hypothetical protein